ncbi:hypothetical protein BC937DRAFT_88420 [Endogone sp. FLAS-F59071]|nr:hypothetical protein BC937DRAFT_88420 [Endogone sp. FLAS-F59071]|eukprot:RUS18717.1 hypothetical protein BC937DRAFT_88420 [Endogone sp. FLAS-F59071]
MLGPYRRYFRQTLLGCTTESCPAAQQPVARDPPDAATIAFSLAQTSQAYTCPHAEAVPDTFGVSLGDLEQLYNECQATGDFEAMSRMVSNTFGTSPSLASSFLDTTGSVDKYSVQQAYALLIHKCPSNVKEAFLKGILEQLRLLKSLDLTPNVDTSKLLPLLVILLQNPLLLDPESHAEVLPSVCEVLCKLPQYHHPVLCHDLLIPPSSHIIVANGPIHNKDDHEYMARELEHLIGIFHHFVTLRLLSRTDDNMTPNRDVAIMNATKCLAMFCILLVAFHPELFPTIGCSLSFTLFP